MMKKYKLYLFDFDYTLADSSKGIVMCFQNVLKRNGYRDIDDETIKHTIGLTLEQAFSSMTGETDPSVLARWRKEYVATADRVMNDATRLFEEVPEMFESLRKQGAKIGIISTKYRYRIEDFLLRHFEQLPVDLIIGGEDVSSAKPSPEGINAALNRLNVSGEDTLYCGDSTVDGATAQNAGVDFMGVLHGVTPREELERYPNVGIVEDFKSGI